MLVVINVCLIRSLCISEEELSCEVGLKEDRNCFQK